MIEISIPYAYEILTICQWVTEETMCLGPGGNNLPGPRRKLFASLQEESIEKHPSIADLSSVPPLWAGSTSLGCSISAEKVWLIFGPVPHLWASSTSLGCSTSKTCSTSHAFPLFLKVAPRSGEPSEARTAVRAKRGPLESRYG